MEVDADPRKRNVPTATEYSLPTNKITPTRSLRPQKYRGLAGIPKKTQKEGQEQIKKRYEKKLLLGNIITKDIN